MADTKTTGETTRSPVDGTELVRLAVSGANYKASLNEIFTTIGRTKLTSTGHYYFAPTGSDTTGDGTVGNPWRQPQHGFDVVAGTVDFNSNDCYFHIADGSGYDGLGILQALFGVSHFVIVGNNTTPSNVVFDNYSLNNSRGSQIYLSSAMDAWIGGIKFDPPAFGIALEANSDISGSRVGVIYIGEPTFTIPTKIIWGGFGGGAVVPLNIGNVFDWGSAQSIIDTTNWATTYRSFLAVEGGTANLVYDYPITGTPDFPLAFYSSRFGSSAIGVSPLFGTVYAGITGKRFFAELSGQILNQAPDFTNIPGNQDGVCISDGIATYDSGLIGGGSFSNRKAFTGLTATVKTQFDKTSDTTLADVTDLFLYASLNKLFYFEAVLLTTSDVAGGIKAAIAAKSGGTLTVNSIIYDAIVTDATAIAKQDRTTTLGTAVGGVTAVTAATIIIRGTFSTNASGYVSVQFAQNASKNVASSVLVGSSFRLWDAGG